MPILPLLGVLALACYTAHAAVHLFRHEPEDLLWACHLGAALVGLGLLTGKAAINGMGTLFLCLGTPLWILDLLGGGEFLPSSCLTHLGGLAIGLYGIHKLGLPVRTWWMTTVALVGLIAICRLVTPARANVNVAFAIERGWEGHFSSHLSYLATMIALASGYFWVVGHVLGRWLAPRRPASLRIPEHENFDSSGRAAS